MTLNESTVEAAALGWSEELAAHFGDRRMVCSRAAACRL